MKFTNPFLSLIIIFIIILAVFLAILIPTLNVRNKRIKREWQQSPQTMGMEVVMIFFLSFLIIFFLFIVDFALYGPSKQLSTSSFTISGRDETIVVTVKDKQIGNQTFAFDDTFQLISDVRNVNGKLLTDLDDEPFVYHSLLDFKKNFVNNKKKTKFKLIYREEKYINETLFQTIARIFSGRKVKQSEIKTSVDIKITEDPDFDYKQ